MNIFGIFLNTEKFTYSFANWTGFSKTVIEDFTITANFGREYVNYTVTFYSEDGVTEILKKADYHYGDLVTVPSAPGKVADKANTYEFTGWDKEVINVDGNARYIAMYKAIPILYVFRISGGRVVENDALTTVKDGDIISVTADPAPEGKIFDGWYVNGVLKSKDINYTYTFDASIGNLDLESRYVDIVLEDTNGIIVIENKGLSYGVIAGIVIASLIVICIGAFVIYWVNIIKKILLPSQSCSIKVRKRKTKNN